MNLKNCKNCTVDILPLLPCWVMYDPGKWEVMSSGSVCAGSKNTPIFWQEEDGKYLKKNPAILHVFVFQHQRVHRSEHHLAVSFVFLHHFFSKGMGEGLVAKPRMGMVPRGPQAPVQN